jgi:hypothetical protein
MKNDYKNLILKNENNNIKIIEGELQQAKEDLKESLN